jgi:hypothetical protein
MTGTQKIGLATAILAVLGVAVYSQSKKDKEMGSAVKDKTADLPEIKGSEDVDKIVITNADKGEVVLEKKGDKWQLTKPVTFPANQANVKSLIDNLKELKTTELIEANPSEDVKKSYQLDPAHAIHVVAYKGADKKVDDLFGKSGGRGQMVMAEGKPGIYSSSGYSGYLYGREVKAWRDTEIFKFDDANAISLTIAKAEGTSASGDAGTKKVPPETLSFTKGGDKWAGTANGKAIPRFNDEKVKDALRTFKALNADDFGDGKGVDATGLDKPESVVTVELKDGAGKYTLKVGKVSTGTARYATKDGSETVYTIGSSAADWALGATDKFQHPLDGGAKDAGSAPKGGHDMPPGMPPGMMPDMPHDPHGH